MDNFVYKGEWFLPSKAENRVSGILTYNLDVGSTLELYGDLGFDLINLKTETIIQGITSDSKKITCYNCFMIKAEGISLVEDEEIGKASVIYSIGYIFEGVYINDKTQMNFQKISCEIYNLDEWLGISGFKINTFAEKGMALDIQYIYPDPIEFDINDNLHGRFDFILKHPTVCRYQKEIMATQTVEFSVSSNSCISFDELLKYLFTFQEFLILSLYRATYPISIKLYSDNYIRNYGKETIRKEIKLYFEMRNVNRLKPKFDFELLFCYRDIKDTFQDIIKKWFEKYELLKPAFALLFEQFYNDERFSENTFLNLAQAAETFHARVNDHTKMPKREYEEMRENIYSLSPEKYHGWLKEQFNFGNYLNLQSRLADIVNNYSTEMLDTIIGDKETFVKEVKWSRNYYTHYSSTSEKKALKGTRLFYLTEKLKIVLVCAFLIEVGFDKEKINDLIQHYKSSHMFS